MCDWGVFDLSKASSSLLRGQIRLENCIYDNGQPVW